MIEFLCPQCRHKIVIRFLKSGEQCSCPRCKAECIVPAWQEGAGAEPSAGMDLVVAELAGDQPESEPARPVSRFIALPFVIVGAGILNHAINEGWSYREGEFIFETALAFMFLMLASAVYSGAVRRRQRYRDWRARQALHQLRETGQIESKKGLLLMLRPSYTTGELTIKNNRRWLTFPLMPVWIEPRRVSLEVALVRALEPLGTLVTLVGPDKQSDTGWYLQGDAGSARITAADSEWKAVFRLLAPKAAMIIIIPLHTEAIAWEIEWTRRHNLLSRCAIIMPPTDSARGLDLPDLWQSSVLEFLKVGVSLPPYDPLGSLFRLDNGGQVAKNAPMIAGSDVAYRNRLKRLFLP